MVDGRWLMVTVLLTGEAFSIQHCTTMNVLTTLLILLSTATIAQGFAPIPKTAASFRLSASTEDKVAKEVTGEDLELMLQEWDEPLIIDAYATWCGPCLLMAPEFEAAAKELEGKVRFCKIDTDKEEQMAGRLNVMGLPTLMFLDKATEEEGAEPGSNQAAMKGKIEGAIRKDDIVQLCEHYFFGGPRPEVMG